MVPRIKLSIWKRGSGNALDAPYDPAAIHASYSKNLNTFENITSLLKTQQRLLISQSKAKLLKTAYKALHDLLPT